MRSILIQEKNHFTGERVVYILVSFISLFATQTLYGSKAQKSTLPDWARYTVLAVYFVIVCLMTRWGVNKVSYIQTIKESQGYKFDEKDIRFDGPKDVLKLAFFCMIAAVLCGCTGIAGGMILGPLFLTYNMVPQIMSATNQYITMIASICVALQFIFIGAMNLTYAGIFGVLTLGSAFVGLHFIGAYVKKTGKQSIILVILTLVLTLALISLPMKYLIDDGTKTNKLTTATTTSTNSTTKAFELPMPTGLFSLAQ